MRKKQTDQNSTDSDDYQQLEAERTTSSGTYSLKLPGIIVRQKCTLYRRQLANCGCQRSRQVRPAATRSNTSLLDDTIPFTERPTVRFGCLLGQLRTVRITHIHSHTGPKNNRIKKESDTNTKVR